MYQNKNDLNKACVDRETKKTTYVEKMSNLLPDTFLGRLREQMAE